MVEQQISLMDDRRNHLDCENCIINILHQHLRQIDENTPTFNLERQRLTRLKEIFAQLGAIILTLECEVTFMTQRAKQLLSKYFSLCVSYSLPKSLQHWLKHQIKILVTSESSFTGPSLPLHIEQAGKRLSVRLISNFTKNQCLVLLEEEKLESFSIASLELIGLTKREAEVLFWVTKDKSNSAISKLLCCSKGTVRKHLEHIHHKLGVQSRTAAVIVALERLGLLKGEIVTISS